MKLQVAGGEWSARGMSLVDMKRAFFLLMMLK